MANNFTTKTADMRAFEDGSITTTDIIRVRRKPSCTTPTYDYDQGTRKQSLISANRGNIGTSTILLKCVTFKAL